MNIDFKKNNNDLTIYLSGKIDADNAEKTEAAITEIINQFPEITPSFNAEKLEYISSAGLRVLLKFRKKFDSPLDIFDLSNEVYDIFDVTGFNQLFNTRKKLREISIKGCPEIGRGTFGTVYRIDKERIVKVFNEGTDIRKIEEERKTAQKVFIHGIPTAISFEMVKTGDSIGVIYEMIDADTVAEIIRKHPERLEELSIKTGKFLRHIHSIEIEDGVLPSAHVNFQRYLQKNFDLGLLNEEQKTKIAKLLDDIPVRKSFLHFDFQPANVMLRGDEMILIDIGDASMGNPLFDIFKAFIPFVYMPSQADGSAQRLTKLADATLIAMWDKLLPAYLNTNDEKRIKEYNRIIEGYSFLNFLWLICYIPEDDTLPFRRQKIQELKDLLPGFMKIIDTLHPLEF